MLYFGGELNTQFCTCTMWPRVSGQAWCQAYGLELRIGWQSQVYKCVLGWLGRLCMSTELVSYVQQKHQHWSCLQRWWPFEMHPAGKVPAQVIVIKRICWWTMSWGLPRIALVAGKICILLFIKFNCHTADSECQHHLVILSFAVIVQSRSCGHISSIWLESVKDVWIFIVCAQIDRNAGCGVFGGSCCSSFDQDKLNDLTTNWI